MFRAITISLFLGLAFFPTLSHGEMLGHFFGKGPALEEKGVTAEAVLTIDFLRNIDGGARRSGTILGNFDLSFTIDTAKAGFWNNGTFFLYGLGNFNENGMMTGIVGDAQGTSNIEADEALKLYQAWYEHQLSDRSSFLFGLHDYNSEFDVLEYAGLFTNSSFGISPDISQVGPSIFPLTALGGRLKTTPLPDTYLLAVLYDGIPGDPNAPKRTSIRLADDDGVFAGIEFGFLHGEPGFAGYYKLALGGWLHTAEMENFDGSTTDDNQGFYFIAEKTLFTENADGQGLGLFFQLGFADSHRNQIGSYWGAGAHYTGLLPGRDQDITGLAIASARNGRSFLDHYRWAEGSSLAHTETTLELTYRMALTDWFVLQPDIQYVINPGMDPALDDALLIGLRTELTF